MKTFEGAINFCKNTRRLREAQLHKIIDLIIDRIEVGALPLVPDGFHDAYSQQERINLLVCRNVVERERTYRFIDRLSRLRND